MSEDAKQTTRGFIQKPGLSISSSGQIGLWEHGIEIKNAGLRKRAQGRAQEIPDHHADIIHAITCLHLYLCILQLYSCIHMWLNPFWSKSSINFAYFSCDRWDMPKSTRTQESERAKRKGSYPYKMIEDLLTCWRTHFHQKQPSFSKSFTSLLENNLAESKDHVKNEKSISSILVNASPSQMFLSSVSQSPFDNTLVSE